MPISLPAHLPNRFMAGLPKIALARLKANPEAPKSSSAPLGPDAFQGGQHLDANLLAAFLEKALTEKERTQMLNHLSQCAECREVAALALPAEVAAAEAPRGAAWRRSNPWLVLRWGAMAAVVGALALVVVLHPAMWNQHPEISKEMPPQTPAGNFTPAPQPAAAPPSAPAHPENARAKGQVQARESAGERAAIGSASGSNRDSGMNDYVRHAPANEQIIRMASPQPPATLKAQNAPATGAMQEGRGGSGLPPEPFPRPLRHLHLPTSPWPHPTRRER